MTTSLARQLKKLAAPQTDLLKADKKKPSILFDPREAANISRDEIYQLGLSGLEELEKLDARFTEFRNSLFSQSSLNFERAVQTSEINRKIDEQVKHFLILVSPYFPLKSAHKTLEWLVNRYHVHRYNTEDWIMCILPFHDTKIFVRAVQILELRNEHDRWFWLSSLQKPGVPLSKNILLNRCSKDPGFFKFICSIPQKFLGVHASKPEALKTATAFFTTAVIGALEYSAIVSEEQISLLLPALLAALGSRIHDLVAGCYMIIAQISRKAKLVHRASDEIVHHILKDLIPDLVPEAITVLVVMYSTQNVSSVTTPGLKSLMKHSEQVLAAANSLASAYQISAFMSPFIESLILGINQTNNSTVRGKMITFLSVMVEEVAFVGVDQKNIIKSFVLGYLKCFNKEAETNEQLKETVKGCLARLETRYPECFEASVHLALSSNPTSEKWKEEIHQLLGIAWDTEETTLFLKLNHSSAEVRASAVQAIVKVLMDGKVRNQNFAMTAIVEQLTDSNPQVVEQVLNLKERLLDLIPSDQKLPVFLKCLALGQTILRQEWEAVRISVIQLVCSRVFLETLSDEQEIELFLALLPFTFPLEVSDLGVLKAIADSDFGRQSPMIQVIGSNIDKLAKLHPNDNTASDRVYSFMEHLTPFVSPKQNIRLLERILADLEQPNQRTILQLAEVLIVAPLIRTVDDQLAAHRYRKEFLDRIVSLSAVAKESKTLEDPLDLCFSFFVSRALEGDLLLQPLAYSSMQVFEEFQFDWNQLAEKQWSKLDPADATDASLLFNITLFRFLVTGLTNRSAPLFQKCLRRFLDKMGLGKVRIFFLSLIWNSAPDGMVDDTLRVVALKMAAAFLREGPISLGWAVDLRCYLVPQLLAVLVHTHQSVRRAAMDVVQILGSAMTTRLVAPSFVSLIESMNRVREELEADPEQLKMLLAREWNAEKSSGIWLALFGCLNSDQVPDVVRCGLSTALEHVNSASILDSLLTTLEQLIDEGLKSGLKFGAARSAILAKLLERFTVQSASVLATSKGWNVFQKAMKTSEAFIETDQLRLSPQDIVVEVVTKDLFRSVPNDSIRQQIYRLLLDVVVETDKAVTARQARRALKRITVDAKWILPHLEWKNVVLEQGTGPAGNRRGRQRPKPSQSPLWNSILAVLEVLQGKKEVAQVDLLIGPLFDLLKSCLDEEEQTGLEYSKQLILSCLLSCCQKLPQGHGDQLAAKFNTGLIVQCIRVSNNPQTHHQALLLLSLAAQLFASHVLHNIMAIFTFMGTSVLRQDDAYSFQVIAKTLESVIPTVIQASNTAVEPVVTTVIHVFADALPEVPEHRRIPIFDKLLTTLDPDVYLWLAPTLILSNMATQGPKLAGKQLLKTTEEPEAGKERMTADVEFALNVCHLYKPQVQLKACIRILEYLQTLPVEKEERCGSSGTSQSKEMSEGSAPFALEVHTTRQLCHFKLLLVNFISTLLSSKRLVEQLVELDESEKGSLESLYRRMIEVGLQYTQSVARLMDQPAALESAPNPKFWRALLHRSYDVIDRINSLLPRSMFISVVKSLLSHALPSIRRRAMELLSAKLQHQSNFFGLPEDEGPLLELLPPLTSIAGGHSGQGLAEEDALNQQTAFFTLKLLCRLLGPSGSAAFRPVLDEVVVIISPEKSSPIPILASAFLCLAELIQNMGVNSLPYLPRYGANLVARLEHVRSFEHHDLLLLSIVTAVCKLVETLPQFLVPYLASILKPICYLSTRYGSSSPDKPGPLQLRLQTIRQSLATSSSPRCIVSSVVDVFHQISQSETGEFQASPSVGPLLIILSDSFAAMSRQDLVVQLPALTTFFLKALDARAILSSRVDSGDDVKCVEEPVVSALVSLVLKLSEASFRPLFFQLYDWATQNDAPKERLVSFYHVTMEIAEKLKGLFVLFAGHFLANAAQVLTETNLTVRGSLPFQGPQAEENTILILEYVLRCLYRICLHDNENFINKERFEMLMEPLVDQLENRLGSEQLVQDRIKDLLIPLLAQMAVAASDDYLWKALHYQLLMKARNNSPHVRLASMNALSAVVEKLGEDYLALLPEAIPILAELFEDDVPEVEVAAQKTIQNFENLLGENLQKYF